MLEELGRGSMGVVYRAQHRETRDEVALKALSTPSEKAVSSLRREIYALARIRHPGIVRIYEEGVSDGLPWYAMELLEGQTLRQLMELQPDLAIQQALTLVRWLCAPLAFLHGEGIVHLDLKPENVVVQPDGVPVLVDFGLVSQFSRDVGRESVDEPQLPAGTLAYMAPELLLGKPIDARTDLYSLGCLLYELLTGRPPFVGTPREVIHRHLNIQPLRPSELVASGGSRGTISPELEELVLRMLAKEPHQRQGHADAIAAILARLGAVEKDAAPQTPRPRAYLYRPSLAGREEAMQLLLRGAKRLEEGIGSLALISGESGVGKTRLALDFAHHFHRQGRVVLAGECASPMAEDGSATEGHRKALSALLKPLQSLGDRCRSWGRSETDRLLGRRGPLLALYEPSLSQLPGQESAPKPMDLPPAQATQRLFDALTETLATLTEASMPPGSPCLLILDDLHWADELTLGWLNSLLQVDQLGKMPLQIVALYRRDEASDALQKLAATNDPSISFLHLGRLPEGAVGTMVSEMLAHRPPPPIFVRYLTRHSEGNPFFVAEYLRTAIAEGVLFRDGEGRWKVADESQAPATAELYETLPLPHTLRETVSRRLDSLSPDAKHLAECAAILGREAEQDFLLRMARLEDKTAGQTLAELRVREVFDPDTPADRIWFSHDKLREVAYQGLAMETRRALHHRAAEAFESLSEEVQAGSHAEIGYHWERAQDFERARKHYLAGARRAKIRYVYAEAERLYRAYFALIQQPSPESGLAHDEFANGVLLMQGRLPEVVRDCQTAIEEALVCGDPVGEKFAYRTQGIARYKLGEIEEAKRLYQRALEVNQPSGNRGFEGKTLCDLAIVERFHGHLDEAWKLYERALAAVRESRDAHSQSIILLNIGILRDVQGHKNEMLLLLQESHRIASEEGFLRLQAKNLSLMALCHEEKDLETKSLPLLRKALAIERQIGELSQIADTLGKIASACEALGFIEESLERAEESANLRRTAGQDRYYASILRVQARLQRRLGQFQTAEKLLAEAEPLLRKKGDTEGLGTFLCQAGHLALSQGRDPGPSLREALGILADLQATDSSPLGSQANALRRAVECADAGQFQLLFRGELWEDIPERLRQKLLELGSS